MKHVQLLTVLAAVLCFQTNAISREQDFSCLTSTTAVWIKFDTERLQIPTWLEDSTAGKLGGQVLNLFAKASNRSTCLATIDIPYSRAQPVVRILVPAASDSEIALAKSTLKLVSASGPIFERGHVIASPTHEVAAGEFQIDESIVAVDRKRYSAAAQQVAGAPLQLVFVPPNYLWETLEEAMPELPESLGGGATTVLTKGVRWVAVGVDLEAASLAITVKSASPEAAQAFSGRLKDFVKRLIKRLPGQLGDAVVPMASFVDAASIDVTDDQIQLRLKNNGASIQRLITDTTRSTGAELAIRNSRHNLRQLALGVVNYESAFGAFPPAIQFRKDEGKSGLSWRVHILPFMEQNELYSKFKLDEPWDSEHNRALIAEMPDIFKSSDFPLGEAKIKPGYTTFVAPGGEGTILGDEGLVKIRNVRDGTSKTVLIVEVKPELAVPWTAPRDYAFEPEAAGAGLAWNEQDSTGIVFSDGAWMLIPKSTPNETLRRLFLRDDGLPIRLDQ